MGRRNHSSLTSGGALWFHSLTVSAARSSLSTHTASSPALFSTSVLHSRDDTGAAEPPDHWISSSRSAQIAHRKTTSGHLEMCVFAQWTFCVKACRMGV
ncbi:unnamed protein product [Gadus morhua 'NCC']